MKYNSEIKLQKLSEYHATQITTIATEVARVEALVTDAVSTCTPRVSGDNAVPNLQRYIDIVNSRRAWIGVAFKVLPTTWDAEIRIQYEEGPMFKGLKAAMEFFKPPAEGALANLGVGAGKTSSC